MQEDIFRAMSGGSVAPTLDHAIATTTRDGR